MRIEQLKFLVEISKTHSVNAAAQNLFISQQGISDAIKRMERELGLVLLERKKTGVHLTKEGETILPYVEGVLEQYKRLEQCVFHLSFKAITGTHNHFTIYTNPLSFSVIVPELVTLINKNCPHLILHCAEDDFADMLPKIARDCTALGIVMLLQCDIANLESCLPESVACHLLFEDEIVACVARHSPLTKKKYLTLTEFNALPKSSCSNTYSFRKTEFDFVSSNTDFQAKLIMSETALGISIKNFFAKTFSNDSIIAMPIKPSIKINYYLLCQKQLPESIVQDFIPLLFQYITTLTGQTPHYTSS